MLVPSLCAPEINIVPVYSYCIDGTNIVRGCFGYGGQSFREQEEADAQRLIAAFDQLCEQYEGRLEIEIYFDGPFRSAPSGGNNLSVRFTRETEADEIILGRVRASAYGAQGRVTVVTADSELGGQVKQEGGRWQKVRPGTSLEEIIDSIERRFSK